MIDLSHGELRSLVAKAFRGAGYSWGLTEEASFAAGFLAEAGYRAAESVVRLLAMVDGRPVAAGMPDQQWRASVGFLCPICVGTSLVDRGGCDALEVGPTAEPLLLAPFLAASISSRLSGSANTGKAPGYVMSWQADGSGAGRCEVSAAGVAVIGNVPPAPVELRIESRPVAFDPGPTVRRVQLSRSVFTELERFAHRVYAPATDASRNAGAGAGTADND